MGLWPDVGKLESLGTAPFQLGSAVLFPSTKSRRGLTRVVMGTSFVGRCVCATSISPERAAF